MTILFVLFKRKKEQLFSYFSEVPYHHLLDWSAKLMEVEVVFGAIQYNQTWTDKAGGGTVLLSSYEQPPFQKHAKLHQYL